MHPAENECVFGRLRTLLKVSGGFQSSNMLQLGIERCRSVSLLSAGMFLTIISVKILHKCDETSLIVTNIAVGPMLLRSGPDSFNIRLKKLSDHRYSFRFHRGSVAS